MLILITAVDNLLPFIPEPEQLGELSEQVDKSDGQEGPTSPFFGALTERSSRLKWIDRLSNYSEINLRDTLTANDSLTIATPRDSLSSADKRRRSGG